LRILALLPLFLLLLILLRLPCQLFLKILLCVNAFLFRFRLLFYNLFRTNILLLLLLGVRLFFLLRIETLLRWRLWASKAADDFRKA